MALQGRCERKPVALDGSRGRYPGGAHAAENFEIQVGFRCNQTMLRPSYTAAGFHVPVYRSYAGDGDNKGKFFALFHVLTLTAGGIFVCYNPATPES